MCGIDGVIKKAEGVDLTGEDVMRITKGKTAIMKYSDLGRFNNIDNALGANGCMVLLYETQMNYGHWVCVFKINSTTLEFFDPYGLAMDEELQIINANMRDNTPHLTHLVNISGYRVLSNIQQLQEVKEHVNTCGRWVALRIRMRTTPLKEFVRLMTKPHYYKPDLWVSALTLMC